MSVEELQMELDNLKKENAELKGATTETVEPVAAFKDAIGGKIFDAFQICIMNIGEEIGFFTASISLGPATSDKIAAACGMHPRYCKEYCLYMAALKIMLYKGGDIGGTYEIDPKIAPAFEDRGTLALAHSVIAVMQNPERAIEAFKQGKAIPWGEQHPYLGSGAGRFFGPIYHDALVPNLPAAVKAKLEEGCKLLDLGCGEGVSCCVFGKAFPKSTIHGMDKNSPSIVVAKKNAAAAGLANVTFADGNAGMSTGGTYDIVSFLDCFHDMSVAGKAARAAFDQLKPGGLAYLMEPDAAENDSIHEQLAKGSAVPYLAFSLGICLPCGMEDGGDALGTLVPDSKTRELFRKAGFSELVRTPETIGGFRMFVAKKP